MINYSIRFDGHEIGQTQLHPNDCDTQYKRDVHRQEIAKMYAIPTHYIRLMRIPEFNEMKDIFYND